MHCTATSEAYTGITTGNVADMFNMLYFYVRGDAFMWYRLLTANFLASVDKLSRGSAMLQPEAEGHVQTPLMPTVSRYTRVYGISRLFTYVATLYHLAATAICV